MHEARNQDVSRETKRLPGLHMRSKGQMLDVGHPTFAAEREGADAFVRRASTMSVERPLCLGAATTFIIRTPVKVDVANIVAAVASVLTS